MPRAATSRRFKAAYTLLFEAELEQCVAKCRLQNEKERAEHSILSLTNLEACDLGSFHRAEASVQWWQRVIEMTTKIMEEQRELSRPEKHNN